MKKNMKYSVFVFVIFVLCLSVGIYIGFNYTKNNKDLTDYNEVTAEDNEDLIDNATPVITKTYNIELVYQDEYTRCGHVIETSTVIYGTNIDKLKENEKKSQDEKGIEYSIVEESNEKLVYRRSVDQNCPNHFLVKLEEGTIVIYNIVDESAMTIYKKIEVDSDTLNPEMLEELNIGIKANSKEELNLIIEDIES